MARTDASFLLSSEASSSNVGKEKKMKGTNLLRPQRISELESSRPASPASCPVYEPLWQSQERGSLGHCLKACGTRLPREGRVLCALLLSPSFPGRQLQREGTKVNPQPLSSGANLENMLRVVADLTFLWLDAGAATCEVRHDAEGF